ncbi:MAG: hypothetical protein QG608_785 [Actinomycetota bacterium]|nr:hypothetical protein [Actinomycetota bacterium]
MAKKLTVDADKVKASAKLFENQAQELDKVWSTLAGLPTTMMFGEFEDAKALASTVSGLMKTYTDGTMAMKTVHHDLSKGMETAALVLTDADKKNDITAKDSITDIGS